MLLALELPDSVRKRALLV